MRSFMMVGLLSGALGSVSAGVLGGCATNTGKGALIGGGGGAALGAGIGALAGGGKGALIGGGIGAAVGAGTGALIGRYMDKQEEELKEVKGANVERQGDQLVVKFNSAILFDTGKAELKAQSQKDLTDFSEVLKKYPQTDITVEGHTDSTGSKAVNERLSGSRAESVLGFLASRGVDKSRMTGHGFADTQPVADNNTEDGRAQNRRVQIKIVANEELKKQDAAAAQQNPPPSQR